MRTLYLFLFLFLSFGAISQSNSLGDFTHAADIGKPKKAGSSSYDQASKTYTVKGAGYNIWFNRDEFQYLYNKISGDFILTGNFEFITDTGNAHRKFGWMIRESEDAGAVHITAAQHADGLVALQWRPQQGVNMRDPEDEIFFPTKKIYKTVQLERKGNMITMRIGNPGEPLQLVGSHEMKLPESVLAGIYVCSHNEDNIDEVKVTDVKIEKPKKK
ncbi:MAG: hypothetical protein JNK79_10995 [Chitinophagaceae bacterium]|nr:hypothetical protein [Chitinophagaceae bacterium]